MIRQTVEIDEQRRVFLVPVTRARLVTVSMFRIVVLAEQTECLVVRRHDLPPFPS